MVNGSVVTASVASFMRNNANSSADDLADLSKMRPRWKYGKHYRPTMNFGVTLDFLRIVEISIFDRSKDALKHGFYQKWRFCQ